MNIPKLEAGQVVQLEWADSKSLMGWAYNPRVKRKPGKISTIGYVVQANDECVTVTTSMDFRGASIDDFSIPNGCITKLAVLDEALKCPLLGKEE